MGRQEGGWRVLCDGVWVCWIGEGGGVEGCHALLRSCRHTAGVDVIPT